MAFETKKTAKVIETPSFASRMSSIKNMFKVTHEDASKAETEVFIENISKLI